MVSARGLRPQTPWRKNRGSRLDISSYLFSKFVGGCGVRWEAPPPRPPGEQNRRMLAAVCGLQKRHEKYARNGVGNAQNCPLGARLPGGLRHPDPPAKISTLSEPQKSKKYAMTAVKPKPTFPAKTVFRKADSRKRILEAVFREPSSGKAEVQRSQIVLKPWTPDPKKGWES